MLNAFRHQRSNHGTFSQRRCLIAGAQRLSASKIESHQLAPAVPPASPCSTPFGIKDRITGACRQDASRFRVLNAFRHQRSNHRPPPGNRIEVIYVLNAFRHQRSNHTDTWLGELLLTISAQRLSASKIESQRCDRGNRGLDQVLNAFRHQRSNHPIL